MTISEPNAPIAGPELGVDVELPADEAVRVDVQKFDLGNGGLTADPSAPAERDDRLGAQNLTVDDMLQQANGMAGAKVETTAPTVPVAPIPLPFRATSGRYRSQPLGFQLELRVDVDGRRPLRRLSGDYFSISGATTSYFGSWTVDAVTVSATPTTVTIVGTARTTWSTTFTVARVTIPRTRIFMPAAPATIRWSTPSGAIGAAYVCKRDAGAFRTVELEQDRESSVTQFVSYNTGSLASGGPSRTLNVAGAYAEAGIQLLDTGGANVIATAANHIWNNASLHHAMQTHFSRWQDKPQFKVWLLHAMRHEFTTATSTLLGIMFDQQGPQRQGCATFYERIAANTAANSRTQLHTHVHELGHCFNLFHSFHKDRMNPPLPNRPGSLSWMNYPQNYNPGGGAPSGTAAFWAAFPFQFDDLELAHLRHGFRNNVIMGGNPFGTGAALEVADEFADRLSDTSGLLLRIKPAQARPVLGHPVVLEISLIAERTQQVNGREQLHPKFGFVQVAVSRPRGDVIVHRPPVQACVESEVVVSGQGEEQPISAYIGYDAAAGQIFEDPGTYRIRAAYAAPDGTMIVSNLVTVRVAAPRTDEDEQVADLLLGDQTGMALTLLGTDSPYLADGTTALETVAAEYGDHPSAVYAQFALGMNAARPFTKVERDGSVQVRPRDLDRADELLRPAIEVSRGEGGLDDLTVYQAAAYLAESHAAEGDPGTAQALLTDAMQLAQSNDAPASVMQSLEALEE